MMPVGDEHVVTGHRGADLGDPLGVGDPLDAMDDAVDGHLADELAGFGEQPAQPGGQRQSPDGRQVRPRRPGQVETIGRRLRGRALVGEHAAGTLVDHLERADDANEVARGAGGVGEPHAVDRERRLVVGVSTPSAIHWRSSAAAPT